MKEETSLKEAILLHCAELIGLIIEKQKQINLLEEVLHEIDITPHPKASLPSAILCTDEQMEIAEICTEALLQGDYHTITDYYSEEMKILLPENALAYSVKQPIALLGRFLEKGTITRAENTPNIVICSLKYEKMIYRLKYVFHGMTICGFWTDYITD